MQRQQLDKTVKSARTCKKLIRFSAAELQAVNERARVAGQPVACYIRDASLGSRRRLSCASVASADLVRGLARVATNLCRLRDDAAARELPYAERFEASVAELLELIRQLD